MDAVAEAPMQEVILGRSQMDKALALLEGVELFHTPAREPYVSIDGRTWRIDSEDFRRLVAARYYAQERSALSGQALTDLGKLLEARALFEGTSHPVFTRVGALGDAIYLDLCDDTNQAVKITRDGWTIIESAPVRFVREPGMLPLPLPEADGNVFEIHQLLNLRNDDDWILLMSWVVGSLRPTGPYPLLILHGEQGSAKSTTARIVRSLVDPNAAFLRSTPRSERDLAIAARHGWILAFDNLSRIDAAFSDALCRMSTGGTFTTRKLHTDTDEVVLSTERPVIITGIEEQLVTRSDLLDRAILIELPVIPESRRRSESELWTRFEASRSRMMGALLDALSGALRHLPATRIDGMPRMADFALWATAAEASLGFEAGSFMAAYSRNRQSANDVTLEASPAALALLQFAEESSAWTGTATELLEALSRRKGTGALPRSANGLARLLRRLAPNFRAAGAIIEFKRDPDSSRQRLITITKGNQS